MTDISNREKKAYLRNLPDQVDSTIFPLLLNQFGTVSDVYIRRNERNQVLYVLITFESRHEARRAIKAGKVEIEGREVSIGEYFPRQLATSPKNHSKSTNTKGNSSPNCPTPLNNKNTAKRSFEGFA